MRQLNVPFLSVFRTFYSPRQNRTLHDQFIHAMVLFMLCNREKYFGDLVKWNTAQRAQANAVNGVFYDWKKIKSSERNSEVVSDSLARSSASSYDSFRLKNSSTFLPQKKMTPFSSNPTWLEIRSNLAKNNSLNF